MIITRIGHCCLVIEINGKKIITDPGSFSTEQDKVTGIDIVLITHEHGDHIHIPSIEAIKANNPDVTIVTNSAVAPLLDKADIAYTLIHNAEMLEVKTIAIEAIEAEHAEIHPDFPRALNTGFWINKLFFYPGDALIVPKQPVKILAAPVAGPWVKISEVVDYIREVKPEICFPVHDAWISEEGRTITYHIVSTLTKDHVKQFIKPENNTPQEL